MANQEQQTAMTPERPQAEHQWLEKLVGEWSFESEMDAGTGQPPQKSAGKESVRSLGGLWFIAEATSDMPEGGRQESLMTMGYEPVKKRYVGSFVSSAMTQQFVYEGFVDDSGSSLVLEAEGPDMSGGSGTVRYRDVVTIEGQDGRMLTSHILGKDGKWTRFMQARYRRES